MQDLVQLPVGVVWCFQFDCDDPSTGRAVKWNHYASVDIFLRTRNPARNRHTECPCCVMGLTAIRGLRTSACRDSTVGGLPSPWTRASVDPHSTTDLPAFDYGNFSFRDAAPSIAGCLAGTTAPHAAVPIPIVICLHLVSDLTPKACPTDSILRPVNFLQLQLLRHFLIRKLGQLVIWL